MVSPRLLLWYRLYRGKVWHLRMVSDTFALCGQVDEPGSERVHGPVPENARLCEACGAASDLIAEAIDTARQGDPRRLLPGVVGDLVGVGAAALQRAVDAELHDGGL